MQMLYKLFLLVFAITVTCSCNYYTTKSLTADNRTATKLDSLNKLDRYFILHNGVQEIHMNEPVVSEDGKSLLFKPDSLKPEHKLYVQRGEKGKKRYKNRDPLQYNVLKEVHVYSNDSSSSITAGRLPLAQIKKIEVVQHNETRTGITNVAIGMATGAVVVIGLVAIALAGSGGIY